ncbi:MAG TPA: helix-turn-helix domain-containing protein [Roseiflexaceae bacterium]|nr:helix-turn-helix domain-containing protein [Roseiflexaceae bacterium]
MTDDGRFGRLLRQLRKQHDLTQEALARQAYCAVDTVKKIEAGKRHPSRQLAAQFADTLGLEATERAAFLDSARSDVDHLTTQPDTRHHNLPPQATPFIGRADEVAKLDRLLVAPNTRLITITAPGGMGKTRLALAVAEQQLAADRFSDGVFFVALTPISAPEHMVSALAHALDFPLATSGTPQRTPKQQVLDYVREKHMLLVLDNCEHLRTSVAELADAILTTASDVIILATSRERIDLRSEHVFALGGLSAGVNNDAGTLFTTTARRLRPDFILDADTRPDVTRICTLVGGLPLAIELAASWIDTLIPADIAAEIQVGLDVLETSTHDVPDRHRSMRAVFDATWQRLDAAERAIFAQLAVLRGGGTRKAIQAITGATLRQLHQFVGKSLLSHNPQRDRYSIHELLRQYAAEQLATDPTVEQGVRDRHAAYYCAALHERESRLKGAQQIEALEDIERDIENARAAWQWAAAHKQMDLLAQAMDSLGLFYEWQGHYAEGVTAFRMAADALDTIAEGKTQQLQAMLLAYQARFAHLLGDGTTADALLQQAQVVLTTAKANGADTQAAHAFMLLQIGVCTAERDFAAAKAALEQCRMLYRSLSNPWGELAALLALGTAALNFRTDYTLAEDCLQASLDLCRALGHRIGTIESLIYLSASARYQSRIVESERLADEAYDRSIDIGNRRAIVHAGSNLGMGLFWNGKYEQAYHLLHSTLTICLDLGDQYNLTIVYYRLGMAETYLGRYAAARTTFTSGLAAARAAGSDFGEGIALIGLLCIALAERAYSEVYPLATQAIALFTAMGETFFLNQAHFLSALAERGAGNQEQAWRHVVVGLRLALASRNWLLTIESLWAIALLFADRGALERTAELFALTERENPPRDQWSTDVAGRELETISASLPPGVATMAHEPGRTRDLWETARELLAELEAAEWDEGGGEQ